MGSGGKNMKNHKIFIDNLKINYYDKEDQLKFCKVCKNKRMNVQKGIVCGLTGEKPDFNELCPNYEEDPKEVQKVNLIKAEKEKQYKELVFNSGWLFLFLLGIGVGPLVTILFRHHP